MEKEETDCNRNISVTFGLTKKNLEVINKYKNRFEDAEFDRDTWIRVGEEIGWEALSACLWYFRFDYKNQIQQLESRIKELESEKICSCGTPSVIHKCKNCNGIIKYSK